MLCRKRNDRVFFLPKQSQNLDPSYKTDLHFRECLGRVKLVLIIAKYHRTDLAVCSHCRKGKTPSDL